MATIANQITPENWLQKQKFFITDTYEQKNELKETHLEKTVFNKISDILKQTIKIKNYKKNEIIKNQEIITDINKGIDQSTTTYSKNNEDVSHLNLAKHIKTRTCQSTYIDEQIAHDGSLISKETVVIEEPEAWKF